MSLAASLLVGREWAMPLWVSFQYRDFYDVPRLILLRHRGRNFLLNCPFDEARDDYADDYEILNFPEFAPDGVRGSGDLRAMANGLLGRVAVRAVRFDPTLRSQIDLASVPQIAQGA